MQPHAAPLGGPRGTPLGSRREESRSPASSITWTSWWFLPSRHLQRSSIAPRSVLWCNHFRARGHPATTQWISARPARHPTRATGGLATGPGHDL